MLSRELVDGVFEELAAGRVVGVADRASLGIANASIEEVLEVLVGSRPVLLHGTGCVIPSGEALRLKPGRQRRGIRRESEGFATDLAAIAMLSALFSNIGVRNLDYPMVVSPASPLKLTIVGWHPDVERPRGYVHLIDHQRDKFEREGNTWQWVTSRTDVLVAGCVEIEKADFRYPVVRQRTA
jgi:hypothetical protein